MRAFFNLILLIGYSGLAGAIAVYGPLWLPWLDQTLAFGIGALALLGCGLLHEIYVRLGRKIDLRQQLTELSYDYRELQETNEWMTSELESLREGLTAMGESVGNKQGGRTVDEVMAEVKVLQSLIQRMAKVQGVKPESKVKPNEEPGNPNVGGAAGGELPPRYLPPVAHDIDRDAMVKILRAALRNDRVDLVLQPIVSLPQRKRRFYECFSRLRTDDGTMLVPEQYISLAERSGLITAIDNMLLFRCIQLVRKIQKRNENIDFFCNLSPHTLADEDFFGDFVEFLESNHELAGHLVFEFAQTDFARWSKAGAQLLDRLAHLGCRFSLDKVTDLRLNAAELAARHVAFVKIEGSLLLREVRDNVGLLRMLRRQQIDLIVTKVEEEARLVELLDYDVDFGQGFLFGEPRLARPAAA